MERGGEGSIQTSGKINLMCVLHQTSVAFFIHVFLSAPFLLSKINITVLFFFLMDLDYKELRGREFPASKLL